MAKWLRPYYGWFLNGIIQNCNLQICSLRLCFLIVVLSEDVKRGIFDTKDPRSHCLCYRREWRNITSSMDKTGIDHYVDTIFDEFGQLQLDEELHRKHHKMSDLISQHLGVGNFKPYYLKWSEDRGYSQISQEYNAYLDNMCQDFITDIKHLVVQGIEKMEKTKGPQDVVFSEALQHAYLCVEKTANFKGQDNLLFKVEKFLKDPRQNSKPFIIHGAAGCGKTSTMAAVASKIHEWFVDSSVVVMRFLNTTTECMNIYQTVTSVITQICLAYGLRVPHHEDIDTLFKALTSFRATIDLVSEVFANIRPLFIFLDGISQLQPMEESLRALWAIRDFPPNVHLIVSTVAMEGQTDFLHALTTFISDERASIEVGMLSESDAQDVINDSLMKSNRSINDSQMKRLLSAFHTSPSPLYLYHLVKEAEHWNSYMEDHDYAIPESVNKVLNMTIQQMESQYGKCLTSYLTSYIAVSGIGMQERELLDLLICNSDIGLELQSYNEAMEGVHFMPCLLWSQLKQKLRHFCKLNVANSKVVLGYSQFQYLVVVSEKYGTIYPGIDESNITTDGTAFTLSLYEDMGRRYLSEPPSLVSSAKNNRHIVDVTLVTPQPTNIYNTIKLSRLPLIFYILLPVEGIAGIKKHNFFNYNWIITKLKAMSMQALYRDILPVITMSKHFIQEGVFDEYNSVEELDILFEFLQLAAPALVKNPNHLANEILGRLSGFQESTDLMDLVNSVIEMVQASEEKRLVPIYPCLTPPSSMLRHTLADATHLVGLIQQDTIAVTFHQYKGVHIWMVETGELRQRFTINSEQPLSGIIPMSSGEFVVICYFSHLNHMMELNVWSVNTGVCIIKSAFNQNGSIETYSLDQEDTVFMVSCNMEVDAISDDTQRYLLGIDVKSRSPIYTIPVQNVHNEGISQIHFVKGMRKGLSGLVTVGSKLSKDLAYWDLETEELDYKVNLGCYVNHVVIHDNQKLAVCASSAVGMLIVVDLAKGEVRQAVEKNTFKDLADLHVSKQGEHALLATVREGVMVHNLKTGALVKVINSGTNTSGQKLVPSKVCMDQEEFSIMVGYQTGQIKIFATVNGQLLQTLDQHTGKINSLKYEASGKLLSSSDDGCTKVINLIPVIETFAVIFGNEAANWDGIVQFENATIEMKDAAAEDVGNKVADNFPPEEQDVSQMVITADGTRVITGSYTQPITVWDTDTGRKTKHSLGSAFTPWPYLANRVLSLCHPAVMLSVCLSTTWCYHSN